MSHQMRDVGFLPRRPGGWGLGAGQAGRWRWESKPRAQMVIEQPLCAWHCCGQKRKKKADKDPALREEHG